MVYSINVLSFSVKIGDCSHAFGKEPSICTGILKIWWTGMIASTRIHKQNTSALCKAIVTYVLLCNSLPFCTDSTTTLAQQDVDPKIESCRNPVPDQAKSFVRRLDPLHRPIARGLYATLYSPLPPLLRLLLLSIFLPSDKIGVLEQSGTAL